MKKKIKYINVKEKNIKKVWKKIEQKFSKMQDYNKLKINLKILLKF